MSNSRMCVCIVLVIQLWLVGIKASCMELSWVHKKWQVLKCVCCSLTDRIMRANTYYEDVAMGREREKKDEYNIWRRQSLLGARVFPRQGRNEMRWKGNRLVVRERTKKQGCCWFYEGMSQPWQTSLFNVTNLGTCMYGHGMHMDIGAYGCMGVRGRVDLRYDVVLKHVLRHIWDTMNTIKLIFTVYANVEFMYHVWLEGGGSHCVLSR